MSSSNVPAPRASSDASLRSSSLAIENMRFFTAEGEGRRSHIVRNAVKLACTQVIRNALPTEQINLYFTFTCTPESVSSQSCFGKAALIPRMNFAVFPLYFKEIITGMMHLRVMSGREF
ncbi:MAG: hypothetical protein ACI33N_05300 [Desulfovibrionaceae bacterium]